MVSPIKQPNNDKIKNVAILLAVYNGIAWIEDQVKSILDQQDINLSLFISIDPSNDGSEQWCQQLVRSDSRVTLIDRGPSLQSATQNFFNLIKNVDFTPFDYVGFADQDDIWYPRKIKVAIQTLANSHYDGYSSNVEAFWESGEKKLIDKAQQQTRWDHFFEAAGPGCTYVMSNTLISDIQSRLLLSDKLCEQLHFHDWFCYTFARELNYAWFIDSNCYLNYRQHSNNVVGANLGIKAFITRAKHVLNGAAISQSKAIIDVLACDPMYKASIQLPSSRLDYLKLAFNCRSCRRRLKDQTLFFMFCAIMSIYKRSR